ncbi:hypothetical protein ACET3Z_028092 [Daucus carota]
MMALWSRTHCLNASTDGCSSITSERDYSRATSETKQCDKWIAVSRLEAALAATEIRVPRIPVISTVNALPHADPETIKEILAPQITSHVQWEATVKTLLSQSVKKSYESGPKKGKSYAFNTSRQHDS